MKSYRNALAALVLAIVFSTSAAAEGIIWTEKTPPPPSTNGIIHTDTTPPQADGVIWTDGTASTSEGDTLTEIALTLLQSMLSLI
jgi:hypothetical protein